MSATDELRRLLDERGVEWDALQDDEGDEMTRWLDSTGRYVTALDYGETQYFADFYWGPTPQQAIAATLGSCNCSNSERTGTCRDVRSADHTIAFECSECGCWVAYDEYWETGIYVLHETGQEHIHPRYCPNCGKRVER